MRSASGGHGGPRARERAAEASGALHASGNRLSRSVNLCATPIGMGELAQRFGSLVRVESAAVSDVLELDGR